MNYRKFLSMNVTTLKWISILIALSVFIQSCNDSSPTSGIEGEDATLNNTTELITEWNALWLELDRSTNGMRPNATARALGYIHLVGYETAVAEMNGYSSNVGRLNGLDIELDERASNVNLDLALNTAYAEAMDHFMFSISRNVRGIISDLEDEKEDELSENLTESEIENSQQWGRHVARRVIRYSQTDNQAEAQIVDQTPRSYVAPVGEGLWVADVNEVAWFPYWGEVRTFVISANETSSIAPPNSYSTDTGSDYYAKMMEVNLIATASREQNNENLWIAEFWSDDIEGLMMSPPGRQFSIANQLIEQEGLGHEQTLELLLRLGFAMNDAVVSAWDDKYTYNTERPSTYIWEFVNADFETNLERLVVVPNPSFPSYPSGHATFAGAAAGVFIDQFGGDNINFTDRSHEDRTDFRGAPRTYTSFSQMAEENSYSRVQLGVHIEADSDEGLRLGYEIANAVSNFDLSGN